MASESEDDFDGYAARYADSLWRSLPGVYRAEDDPNGDGDDSNGPLREFVKRIGAEMAIVRRSIDRLWEDQSIETCDSWAIPYVAELLGVRAAPGLDSRGERLDVARAIYYRRRAGTIGLIEELARDVTGWDARAVEFFRRLGRTRHRLDPPIESPAATPDPAATRQYQQVAHLSGRRSQTPAGGWTDLRDAYAAAQTNSAWDEFSHTADTRRGEGSRGRYAISRLGIFLWRLPVFPARYSDPVKVKDKSGNDCPGHYVFDPTGREIPLFLESGRRDDPGDETPQEWDFPGPLSQALLDEATRLYGTPDGPPLWAITDADGKPLPRALGVYEASEIPLPPPPPPPAPPGPPGAKSVRVSPERGGFRVSPDTLGPLVTTYHYGFGSTIGAGGYDRRRRGLLSNLAQGPTMRGGGGLPALSVAAPVRFADSRTALLPNDVAFGNITQWEWRADNFERPVLRGTKAQRTTITLKSAGPGATLVLDGLLLSRLILRLEGDFKSVVLRCCTLDPGEADNAGNTRKAADNLGLLPTRLEIAGSVRELRFERCVVGPVTTDGSGAVESLIAAETIFQSFDGAGTLKEIALNLKGTEADLRGVTILGDAAVKRLFATDCLLNGATRAEDAQRGCLRFSACWDAGSQLPQKYECVALAPSDEIFVSRRFGQPEYARLRETAGFALAEGAEDGSEMGAFRREQIARKMRGLRRKIEEFLPIGLTPMYIAVGYAAREASGA